MKTGASMGASHENVITVTWWSVYHERIEGGKRILNYPLSANFTSHAKARAALKVIKPRYQNALIGRSDRYFNKLRPGDAKEAATLQASLL